jgi:DNA polymerase-4
MSPAAEHAGERRVIAHCDIDAFFASVELLRRPELRGQPVVVAGDGPRSVVTTASYEARRFGIDSAMPAARARALCPQAVFIAPDHAAYREKSHQVWALVRTRVEQLQQVGIDEAYLDVTELERPMAALRELVGEVERESGLVMSVGVGPSRLVAKTVSAHFKPRALKALSREDACRVFAARPVRVLQGVGPRTAERLAGLGIRTIADLQRADPEALVERFGTNAGSFLLARAHFRDESRLSVPGPAKSRSTERTFPRDVADHGELERTLVHLTGELCGTLARRGIAGRNVAIKVRLDDWTTVTRARTLPAPTDDAAVVLPVVLDLFRTYAPTRPVRLLGVRLAAFASPQQAEEGKEAGHQLRLPLEA